MNELKVFTNERLGKIRTIEHNGEPYFIGKDLAEALGYTNTRDALSKHVHDDDKATVAYHDGRQKRFVTAINESGMYALIFGSQLDKAREFKHWVTKEVLPEIRKTGGYNSQQSEEYKQKRLEVMMINAKARLMKEENKRMELMIKNPESKPVEEEPPVDSAEEAALRLTDSLGIGDWYRELVRNGKRRKGIK